MSPLKSKASQFNDSFQNLKIHFVGVGGIGMCGLAELFLSYGARVSGSDVASNANTQRLEKLGVIIKIGHSPLNIEGAELLVYSSAIPQDNVELQYASRHQIPIIPRAEALAEIMRFKRAIVVAGTHGKTTTTSFSSSIMIKGDMDPVVVVGGKLKNLNSTARCGEGDWMVAEADESDGSFSKLFPEIAVITNIDNDHLDHFKTFENLIQAYKAFGQQIPFYGALVINGDDENLKRAFENFNKRCVTFGFSTENDYYLRPKEIGVYSIIKKHSGKEVVMGHFKSPMLGHYNALNALASIVASLLAGVDFTTAVSAIEGFSGVERRLQTVGEAYGTTFIDDYAHHPTAVGQVVTALKGCFTDQRLIVIFQPHRYSRVQDCYEQFKTCFKSADKVFITDIYPAGEKPLPGVSGAELVDYMEHPDAQHLSGVIPVNIKPIIEAIGKGDVVVTLGAGTITGFGPQLLKKFKRHMDLAPHV